MSTTEQQSPIEVIQNTMYGYTNRLKEIHRRTLFFTEAGAARLASIAGYVLGLNHAGQLDFADKLAADLLQRLEYVALPNSKAEFNGVEIPGMKAILNDDGTLHGFGVCWYRPVDPQQVDFLVDKYQREIKAERNAGKDVWDTALTRAKKELNITERVDPNAPYSDELTEHRYDSEKGSMKYYYRFSYNGGLLYHGPGHGENFAVNLGTCLWGIHT